MNDSVFAKILTGDIPSYKVYEDDKVLAFLDISQLTKGHTLVIPKVASVSILEASDETVGHLFKVATRLAKQIVEKLGASGCNLVTNAHPIAGQEVPYTHVHIIPRFIENDGVQIKGVPSNPTAADLIAVQEKLLNLE